MPIINQYLGATHLVAGATILETKTIFNIKEGYQYNIGSGSTTEYIDLDDYELIDLSNNGAFNQTITFNLENPVSRLARNQSAISRSFKQEKYYTDNFKDEFAFSQNYSLDGSNLTIDTSAGEIVSTLDSTLRSDHLAYTQEEFGDFRIVVQTENSNYSGTADNAILFRAVDFSNTGYVGYRLQITDGVTIELQKFYTGSSWATLAGSSIGIADDQKHWIMLKARGSRIQAFVSTDSENFTKFIDFDDLGTDMRSGVVGLRHARPLSGSATAKFSRLQIHEIAPHDTRESIIKKVCALGRVYNVSVEKEVEDLTSSFETPGSSWVVGTTNGYQQVDYHNVSTGGTWDMFLIGSTFFSDFALECDILGTSGNQAGLILGRSTFTPGVSVFTVSFYGNPVQFDDNNTTNNILHYYGISNSIKTNTGIVGMKPGLWYRLKLVKESSRLRWFINDQFSNAWYGDSLINPTLVANQIGFLCKQNGASGTITSFRNIRVSSLDDSVDTLELNTNSTLDSFLQRYVPNDFAVNWTGKTVNIFNIGSSRSSFGVTDYILQSNENIDNITTNDFTLATGERTSSLNINSTSRISTQLDSTRFAIDNDNNLKSRASALTRARSIEDYDNLFESQNILETTPKFSLERYDQITVVDSILGLSHNYIVNGLLKNYNADNGQFVESFDILKDINE